MERILISRPRIISDLNAGPLLVGIVVNIKIRALVEPMVSRLGRRLREIGVDIGESISSSSGKQSLLRPLYLCIVLTQSAIALHPAPAA